MARFYIIIFVLITFTGCGIRLISHHRMPNNGLIQVTGTDTLIYQVYRNALQIDSVRNGKNDDSAALRVKGNQVEIYTEQFLPGINNIDLSVHCGNRDFCIRDRIYKVSDIVPIEVIPSDVRFLPHDTSSFTQGLVYWNNALYESTGLIGQSKLYKIDPVTGIVLSQARIDSMFFGEGLTVLNDSLWQLTWKNGKVQIFDFHLNLIRQVPYEREGWGLSSCGDLLLASDGSESIYFLNASNLEVERVLLVYDNKGVISFINELEYVNGEIWANVLGQDYVIVIDEKSGKVGKRIDFSHLINRQEYPDAGPLNGIAYNKTDNLIYFTGKNWPFLIVWTPFFAD